MRRLNGTELAALAVAIFLVVAGLVMITRPAQEIIFHGPGQSFPPSLEFVSKDRSRTFGILGVAAGAGIMWMVLFRRRK